MSKLFSENYPDLYAEIHPEKNKTIDFTNIHDKSGIKVFWQCRKNPKHIWRQTIRARTISGYGCPYCSKRKTLPEESFGAQFPKIISELHTSKNGDFDPFKYSSTSNKLVWFKCSNGHEWRERIVYRVQRSYGCKECERIARSLALKYPDIAEEWHPTKNSNLKPTEVVPSSKQKVWWRCKKNPDHEWQVSVYTRVFSKSSCPICARKTLKKPYSLPSLSVQYPNLAKQWHLSKNGELKPSDVSAGSSRKVWWICPQNSNHSWLAMISNRVKGRGCPYCASVKTDHQSSLAFRYPNIAKQFHPTKNGNYTPYNLSYGSGRRVWWQCLDDLSHEWETSVNSRTQPNNDRCPFCTGRKIETNSLQAVHPEIAAQWHPNKNGSLKPNEVTRASGRKVWWQCSENSEHEWIAEIKNRTVLGAGCPLCAKEKNTIRLQEHLFELVHSDFDSYHEFLSNARTLTKFCENELHTNIKMVQPFYRMIFSSIITALETYLSDAFIKIVINDMNLIEKLILALPEFNQKNYALSEIIDWQKNIEKKVSEYLLNNITWHNIIKVKKLYENVLEINFPDDMSALYRAVSIRHDIVHRNGKTKSGGKHKLEKTDLLELLSNMKDFVAHIDSQLVVFKKQIL